MGDRTRAGSFPSDAAEAFSAFVLDWLEDFGSLADALVTLRFRGDVPDAVSALLGVPDVNRLLESWQIWESFAGIDRTEADRRLAPHLGADRVARLRCALWGVTSLGGK